MQRNRLREIQMEDKPGILNPPVWPLWPFLPIKRGIKSETAVLFMDNFHAVLKEDQPIIVYLAGYYSGAYKHGDWKGEIKTKTYANLEEFFEDGWRVD